MKSIREQFEEIWPVPKGVLWSIGYGEYMPVDRYSMKSSELAVECDVRLDTFTRCQETTDVYVSLVDELVAALDHHWTEIPDCVNKEITGNLIDRAKQIIGIEK